MPYQGVYGEWYDDDGNPAPDPSQDQTPPAAPPPSPQNPGPQGVGDPGNDWNQIQGWASQYLGHTFDQSILDSLKGQPLDLVQRNIANSDEAKAYANRGAGGQKKDQSGAGQLASPGSAAGFWPQYNIPAPYQFTPYGDFKEFSYDKYSPLTADQAAAEPGYAFAKQQGRDAIQTSQAAKGNVLSGAALKDLFAWGDQFAGQNYQNAENRNENVYTMNRGNAYNNWAANETGKYQQWAGNTDKGLAAWNANLQPGQFGATLGTNQQGMTLADLLGRFRTTADSLSTIASAGAR